MRISVLYLLSLLAAAPALAGAPTTVAEQLTFLRDAEVVAGEKLAQGVTGSRRLTLELDGYRHAAHFQVINDSKGTFKAAGRVEMNFADTWRHNVAAFLLDELLGLGGVPAAVERTIDGERGALSWWVDRSMMTVTEQVEKGIDPPRPREWGEQMAVMAVFDQLVDNADRNRGNVVIDDRWQIWLIDHTRAFGISKTLRNPDKVSRCGRRFYSAIRALDADSLKKALHSQLSDVRIKALLARRDAIVALLEARIVATAEEAVLFDYSGER